MTTEIYVEGNKVDVSANISSLLNFAIDDIKNFASRSTVYSKTVVLPGTAINNRIFGNIFETGIANVYNPAQPNIGINFNPAVAARCIIFQDNLQTFKGTIRLLEIIRDLKRIEYEVALNGELTALNVALSSGLLTDLDFSAYNPIWHIPAIVSSWNNESGAGVYFPLIDYGSYSTDKHSWNFRTFRPALFVKEYIDKMFAAANFKYECALFNTPRFKKLIVPNNQKNLTKTTSEVLFVTAYEFQPPNQNIINHQLDIVEDWVEFKVLTGGLFSLSESGRRITYNGTTTINTTLDLVLRGNYNFQKLDSLGQNYSVEMVLEKNGGTYDYLTPILDVRTGVVLFERVKSIPITLSTGDFIKIHFHLMGENDPGPEGPANVFITEASIAIGSDTDITSPIDYGETINLAQAIPQNIRQVDFLTSIVKLFNLYVYEDKFDERVIHISPFIEFYSSSPGNTVDWSLKLDRNSALKIKPLSEINSKIYQFSYRDDSDYYNEVYRKRYNQGYGSHIYDSQFEFASQTNKLEIIFAPTPIVGYLGEDKVYSTIFKRTGPDNAAVEETIDSVIRILQTQKITGVTPWDIVNAATDETLSTLTSYGYAGHFNDPSSPDDDLNFGVVKEFFFTLTGGDLTKTQFNVYWASYMAEITDKDSKLLTGKFYLTARDIFELDFSKYVYVDGLLYRLNKISNYNASNPETCTVELLKVINTAYSFPPGELPDTFYWIDEDGGFVLEDTNTKIPTDAG